MDLATIIQGVSIFVIGGAVIGLVKQTNELTRLSTLVETLTARVERLERGVK